jgi:hypothetical protein
LPGAPELTVVVLVPAALVWVFAPRMAVRSLMSRVREASWASTRSRALRLDLDVAAEVGGPDPAREIVESPGAVVPFERAGQAIGRGVGQGDAGQQIKVVQVLALQAQGRLELAEIERPGDRAVRHQPRPRTREVGGEMIGPVAADVDEGPALDPQGQGRAVHAALAVQHEAGAAVARRLARVDAGVQRQAPLLLVEGDVAVGDDQLLDHRQLHALAVVGFGRAERPAGLAVLRRDQGDVGAGEGQQRHLDLAGEQLPEPHGGLDPLDVCRVLLFGPGRAAEFQIAHDDGRGPAEQIHVQIALERDLAIVFDRGPAADRAPQPVPVEQQKEDHDGATSSSATPPTIFSVRPGRRNAV